MKRSLSIVGALVLAASLAACGGSESPAAPSDSAELTECIKSTAEQIAAIKQEPVEQYLDDPDTRAMCEGLAKLDDPAIMPSYTPAPADDVDPQCLRDWAESNADMFDGLSTEEIMEDPMARFACE